jgi:glycosyltransferase involved in cell wall biosynthesis
MTVPVTTVPNAIDLDRFVPGDRDAARARLGLATDRFVVLMLANLAPHKGQITLVRAIDELVRRGVPVEGWLVGEDRSADRQYEKDLRALVAERGLTDTIRFLGFRKDAPDLLQASDAFVLPSTHEGLPLSVLEAQATRVPVIGSTIPGITEVVEDGRTGFTVPADDAIGYADRLQALFADRSLRQTITDAAARRVSQEHAWTTMEERIFGIYRSLIGAPAGI